GRSEAAAVAHRPAVAARQALDLRRAAERGILDHPPREHGREVEVAVRGVFGEEPGAAALRLDSCWIDRRQRAEAERTLSEADSLACRARLDRGERRLEMRRCDIRRTLFHHGRLPGRLQSDYRDR